jgi:hypothetical protein
METNFDMTSTYRVSFNLEDADLATFLKTVGPHCGRMSLTHVYTPPEGVFNQTTLNQTAPPPAPEPVKAAPVRKKRVETKPRKKRVSRVNDTILATLQNGPAEIAPMKEALVAAGLAASSLTTGLQALLKSGEILGGQNGRYRLSGQEELQLEQAAE